MKIINRIDKRAACKALACPAILQDENGDFIIIGKDVTGEVENLAEFGAGCAPHEKIVQIPNELFDNIQKQIQEANNKSNEKVR